MPIFHGRSVVISFWKRRFWVWWRAAALGAGIAALVFLILRPMETSVVETAPSPLGKTVAAADPSATRDSDGDGLKDWEEAIWRTNPARPDSDGDGTADGAEVAQNRDPSKPGPKDKLEPQITADPAGNAGVENNLTFALTRSLLSSGVLNAIDPSGRLVSNDFTKNLTLPQNLDPDEILRQAAVITARDIKVSPSGDPETVKQYFNAIYAVYARHLVPLPKDDLTILSEAVEQEDYARLGELKTIIAAIDRSWTEIKSLPVPNGYQEFAVRELNYLLKTKRAIEVMSQLQADPLAAVVMLRKRFELSEEVINFTKQTKSDLEAKNIVFSPMEVGYSFFQ